MTNQEKLKHFLKSEGFHLFVTRLKVVKGYNVTDEEKRAVMAICKTKYFLIRIIFCWNDDHDFIELVHFGIEGTKEETKFCNRLYVGSYPHDRYRTGATMHYVEEQRLVQSYVDIYGRHFTQKRPFSFLEQDNYNHMTCESWYKNANSDIQHDYNLAVEYCNKMSTHLCVDHPWFIYKPKMSLLERFFPNINKPV